MKVPRTLHGKAKAALKEAVQEVVENHRRSRRPLAVWKNGKVAWVSADRLSRKTR
jgi:hypothetical protein